MHPEDLAAVCSELGAGCVAVVLLRKFFTGMLPTSPTWSCGALKKLSSSAFDRIIALKSTPDRALEAVHPTCTPGLHDLCDPGHPHAHLRDVLRKPRSVAVQVLDILQI